MIRWLVLTLVATATMAPAQDRLRPVARPVASVVAPVAPPTPDPAAILRPVARSAAIAALVTPRPAVLTPAARPVLRPYQRPDLERGAATRPQQRAEQNLFAFSPTAPATAPIPQRRPARIEKAMAERQAAIQRGQVCGDPAIQGDALGAVPGRGRCGIDSGVRVKSVAGVQLRPAATIDCPTAQALKRWVTTGLQPATGGQAISMRVVSHYSCRFRNSAASGRLSEHSFGRAIDIAGIGLKSGREITVLTGWNTQRDGAALRTMWQAACGPFGTVLGPNANRFHRDHFHFDTARYRSGSYCR